MTAAAYLALRNADPEFRRRERESERRVRDEERELERIQKPLTRELAKLGYRVRSVWDLRELEKPYPSLFPVLMKHLARPYPDVIREGIVLALARREASAYWPALVKVYKTDKTLEEHGTETALMNAFLAMADNSKLDEIISMYLDRRRRDPRGLLLVYLMRSKDPRAKEAIERSLDDPALAEEAKHRLRQRRRRATKAAAAKKKKSPARRKKK